MRRSISICEPSFCLAGQILMWKFHFTPASTLPKGARLRFDPQSKGRDIDWALPTTELKRGGNVIYLALPGSEFVAAKECVHEQHAAYDFILPKEIKAGTTITIGMGSYKGSGKEAPDSEIAAQTFTQRRRSFFLYIDPKGKTHFEETEDFHLDIKGNLLHLIRVLTPAFVTRGKRFDITIRFEDQFGNLTGLAPEDTLIELTYEHLRENLNWKLFVPETGFITLPNLYFNEPGTYRIQLKNSSGEQIALSSPIRCYNEDSPQLLWGLLHGESEKIDSLDEPEAAMRHFRDEACYNFYALSPFSSDEALTGDEWKVLSNQVGEFNEEDRFSALLGFQWVGNGGKEGVRHIIYNKEGRSLFRSDDIKSNSTKKLHKSLPLKESMSIPLFAMSPDFGYDFQDFDPDFERVVEIYNAWGCSECVHSEGNPFPISSAPGKVKEAASGSLRTALNAGKRFGFVAGGLDDRNIFARFFDSKQVQYSPGLTAIVAKQHNRDSLFEALYQRHCYATTGARILLDFMICHAPMGSEISALQKPGMVVNRHLHGFVAGTAPISKIEIIRCGEVWHTMTPKPGQLNLELTFDDQTHPSEIALERDGNGFIYYYMRVFQADGHIAWSSPIWIDFDKTQIEVPASKRGPVALTKEVKLLIPEVKSASKAEKPTSKAEKPASKAATKPSAKEEVAPKASKASAATKPVAKAAAVKATAKAAVSKAKK